MAGSPVIGRNLSQYLWIIYLHGQVNTTSLISRNQDFFLRNWSASDCQWARRNTVHFLWEADYWWWRILICFDSFAHVNFQFGTATKPWKGNAADATRTLYLFFLERDQNMRQALIRPSSQSEFHGLAGIHTCSTLLQLSTSHVYHLLKLVARQLVLAWPTSTAVWFHKDKDRRVASLTTVYVRCTTWLIHSYSPHWYSRKTNESLAGHTVGLLRYHD